VKPYALVAALAIAVGAGGSIHAQTRIVPHPLPRPVTAPPPAANVAEGEAGLRAMLGMERIQRLLRSGSDADVARGIARLAAVDTPEAFALLVRALAPSPGSTADVLTGCARREPRSLLAGVRALARFVDREPARKALLDLVDAPMSQLDTGAAAALVAARDDVPVRQARLQLARQQGALALASTRSTAVEEKLVEVARREGPGEASAVAALAAFPPESPAVLGGVTLSTRSMIGLAASIGDLRTLDALLGILKASDPVVRAAALTALGDAGDARALDAARGAAHDPAAKVRVAAAAALVKLGVADAEGAVEALVLDDATALEGLGLASQVQGEGVTRAAAARAAASAERELRVAAVEALGKQVAPSAVTALVELGRDPILRGDAAAAIARSPSAAALPALEAMASRPGEARVAARAYFVRRFVRGARSAPLDGLLARLASSAEARDRAVGVEALVALGERRVEGALLDSDPSVRAAAAMGAAAHLDARTSAVMLARMAVEPDETTRSVLALGLVLGDGPAALPTSLLVERLRSAGTDAPLAALALARRSTGRVAADVEALLGSKDPVMRAHVARGLGASDAPDAAGALGAAYEDETDPTVRRVIVEALALRPPPWGPGAEGALRLAARLDPDGGVRSTAQRVLLGKAAERTIRSPEVLWMSLVAAEGAPPPARSAGAIVDDDGLAVPIAFDDDGFALEPGGPPGPFRLRLAPRLPPYSSPSP
jgi:HEAT repeat protein